MQIYYCEDKGVFQTSQKAIKRFVKERESMIVGIGCGKEGDGFRLWHTQAGFSQSPSDDHRAPDCSY